MREIKFRAWDKYEEQMIYGVESGIYEDPDGIIYFDTVLGLASFEVMQFTGLKDKNGKEIYEGDVVQHLNIHTNHEKWEIEYSRAQFILLAGSTYLPLSHVDLGTVEVIGSKFENPELLEQHRD